MKTCKIIHIHDATANELVNGNRHYMEDYPWAEKIVNKYLQEGYEVKHMIPNYDPAIQRQGVYSFYLSGFTVYLEKEGEAKELDFSKENQIDDSGKIDESDEFVDLDDFNLEDFDDNIIDFEGSDETQ